MKTKKMELFALVIAAVLASPCMAEEKKPKINHDAIPPVISPDDPELQLLQKNDYVCLMQKKQITLPNILKLMASQYRAYTTGSLNVFRKKNSMQIRVKLFR